MAQTPREAFNFPERDPSDCAMMLRVVHRPAHRITVLSRLSLRKLMQPSPSRRESKGKRSTFFVDNLPIRPKSNTSLLTEQVVLSKIPQSDNFNSLNTTAIESTTTIESAAIIESAATTKSTVAIESATTAAIESTTAIESTIFQTSSVAPSPDKSTQPKQRKRKSYAIATPDAFAGQEISFNIEQVTSLSPFERPTRSIVLDTVRSYAAKYPNCVLLTQVGDFYEVRPTVYSFAFIIIIIYFWEGRLRLMELI